VDCVRSTTTDITPSVQPAGSESVAEIEATPLPGRGCLPVVVKDTGLDRSAVFKGDRTTSGRGAQDGPTKRSVAYTPVLNDILGTMGSEARSMTIKKLVLTSELGRHDIFQHISDIYATKVSEKMGSFTHMLYTADKESCV
jgi:hypothetical protein